MPRPSLLLLVCGLLAALAADAPAKPPDSSILRVLTYNIHHGEGMDGVFDLKRIADVLTREQPDLVALQEVDRRTERASQVDQAAELSTLTGMHVVFGKAMDYQGGEYGVAILSRFPFAHVANQALPQADGYEPRTALTVDVLTDNGQTVQFTTTHLDQGRDATNRILQAARINQLLVRNDKRPSILAGDMNSRVDTEVMEKFRSLWTDMFVEPTPPGADRPRYRVDYVLARPGERWTAIDARAIDAPGVSDHRPILAVLELSGTTAPTTPGR